MQELADLRSRVAQAEAAAQQQEQAPRRRRPSSLRDMVAAAAAEPITGDLPAHWQASVQQLQDCSLDTRSSSLHSSSESVMDMATVEVPVRSLEASRRRCRRPIAGLACREALPQVLHIQGTLECSMPNSITDSTGLHLHKGCRSGQQQAESLLVLVPSPSLLAVCCSRPDRCRLAALPCVTSCWGPALQEPQQSTSPDRRSQARGLQQLLQEPEGNSMTGYQTPARPLSVGGRLGLGQPAHSVVDRSASLGQNIIAGAPRGLLCMLTPQLHVNVDPISWNIHQ